MRTAVVRVGVDLAGELTPAQLTAGMARLRESADAAGVAVVENNLAGLPPQRREVELLIAGDDAAELERMAVSLCANAFGTTPVPGVLTFISRGTDDDAHGVLAGLGLSGDIERVPGEDGWDVVHVTLRKSDLERVPESRVHTALEASLNCEVHIRTCMLISRPGTSGSRARPAPTYRTGRTSFRRWRRTSHPRVPRRLPAKGVDQLGALDKAAHLQRGALGMVPVVLATTDDQRWNRDVVEHLVLDAGDGLARLRYERVEPTQHHLEELVDVQRTEARLVVRVLGDAFLPFGDVQQAVRSPTPLAARMLGTT